MSVLNQKSRTTCTICTLRTNSILCDTCKLETRGDLYLLLLAKLKDEGDNYFDLKAKCIDIQDAVEHFNVPESPLTTCDEEIDDIDEHAQEFLAKYASMSTDEVIPVVVAGDGDCLFHSIQTFCPIMSIDELRSRCIQELCTHEQYYETIKDKMPLDLVDDESVQDHALRILNNSQYSSALTIAALSTVIQRSIESIYQAVNEDDEYCNLLNTVFIPLNETQLFNIKKPRRPQYFSFQP